MLKQSVTLYGPQKLRASLVCIAVNLILAAVKLTCGILCTAPALISDAAHSAADLCSTVIVLVGIRLSLKAADKRHPYGHARFESIASILFSGVLLTAGIGIGYGSLTTILREEHLKSLAPSWIAICVALFSILLKLMLFRYLRSTAQETGSTSLRADALHQISDALASLGALCGITAAAIGFPIFDPIASLLIALFLLHAAIRVFIEASTALIDRAASTETECALRGIIEGSEGVAAIGRLRTRAVGTLLFVEAEILLDRALPIGECDRIARTVRRRLAEEHGEIVDCVIVVRGNPPL